MNILTREHLLDGSYLARLALPADFSWSEEDVNRSLAQALEGRPSDMIWVFAYGSLMWNPMLELADKSPAELDGWHRSFSVRSISGRGTLEHPGRVLALEAGGQVQGVALRIRPEVVDTEMRLLWLREMAGGAYLPSWVPVVLASGDSVEALAFVGNPAHPQHETDVSVETVTRLVAKAAGRFGSNADYVLALHQALIELGLEDEYIKAIAGGLQSQSR